MKPWQRWLFRQHMRFQLGASFLVVVNLSLLTLAAADRLERVVQMRLGIWVAVVVIGGLISVWLGGLLLDLVAHYWQAQNVTQHERMPIQQEMIWRLERIEKQISNLS